MRNYWLKQKKQKEQEKEQNAKIEDIARCVTKYIRGNKIKHGTYN